jgi:hypothetical protein
MQIIRNRLRTATCALLAITGTAAAEGNWQLEAGALRYAEQNRVSTIEPMFKLKRDLTNGKSISAQLVFDAITGASPTGATPSNQTQTITSASGISRQVNKGVVPTSPFHDHRAALDVNYEQPLLRTLKTTIGGHLSAEKDYVSRGATLTLNWDTSDRLTTFTAGAGGNFDRVAPTGGRPEGLEWADSTERFGSANKKDMDGMIGITRILSPCWLAQLNYGRSGESGYLTEPYKVVSVLDSTGKTVDYRMEKRPDQRSTQNIMLSSAYQTGEDVIHFSYRYYWDNWGIHSHTFDLKYRFDLEQGHYLEPHVRWYTQAAANFYSTGIVKGTPLPDYATSDFRYGKMSSTMVGGKFGMETGSGEINIRVEYMVQSGASHPQQAVGVQKSYDLFPTENAVIVQIGYTIDF